MTADGDQKAISVKKLIPPKKIILLAGIFIVSLGIAQQATITVRSPNGGENWVLRSTQPITWRFSGVTGVVNIHLYNGTHYVGVVQNNVQVAAGSYSWVVGNYQGGTAAPGTNYKVRIRKPQTEILDDSDGPFTISGTAPTASLLVTSPNGGETWRIGVAYEVRWTSGGISGNANIQLKKGGAVVKSWTAENTGSSYWNCSGVPEGNDYKVRVANTNGSVSDESDRNFAIQIAGVSSRPPLAGSARVETPNGGETWILKVLGVNSATVNWTTSNVSGNVTLTLKKGGNPVRSQSFSNTGSAVFSFAGMAEGEDYKMRIESADNSVSDESDGNFAIKKETLTPASPQPIQLALAIRDFKLNNGAETTDSPIVTMNHRTVGIPTHYRWKNEVMPDWSPWIFYAGDEPKASLPESFGEHTIQFQVKNNNGESEVKTDTIKYIYRVAQTVSAEDAFQYCRGYGWKTDVLEKECERCAYIFADRSTKTIFFNCKDMSSPSIPQGRKCKFVAFGGRLLKEGWEFVSYKYRGPKGKDWGYAIEREPSPGDRDISLVVRLWYDIADWLSGAEFEIETITLKGPCDQPVSEAFR